ncbi:MAG: ATP-binding protein, partial [Clostridia bacterium]|nr:ATP-binding protein [Clostridia bacterium]
YSANIQRITEEYLYCFKSSKHSLIFERTNDDFKFSRNTKTELEPIKRMNTSNKLFLATATMWNTECTMAAYRWFAEKIDAFTNDEIMKNYSLNRYRENSEEYVDFTKELLKQADINISNITVETKEMEAKNTSPVNLVINGQPVSPKMIQVEIKTGHTVKTDNIEKTYDFSLIEESLGTQQLFYIAPIIKETLDKGKVMIVDELDRSMHPFIVKFIVNLFRNKNINKNGAQLIFTTHETSLLSLNAFRRDQIYFTEKNAENGITDIYSLDDFSVRKDENIEKGYLLGRYGAIPYLHTEEIV